MTIQTVHLIYFSPTNTTHKILNAIAEGYEPEEIKSFNLTLPHGFPPSAPFSNKELVLIGAPVYAGRLPVEAVKRLEPIRGNQTPAVIVVMYGNREFDDALIELKHLAEKNGFIPIAAAAFIGEHSFSTPEQPIAEGRPDADDLKMAQSFGARIQQQLTVQSSLDSWPGIEVPGKVPYKEHKAHQRIAPVSNTILCSLCLDCASVCPTSAIQLEDPHQTDADLCITCCACVKICPTGARQMKDPHIRDISNRLTNTCSKRKDPDIFLVDEAR